MIVNPQLFNYKLIIGSLVIAIASLGVFSFVNYNTTKTSEDFVKQENLLVQSELKHAVTYNSQLLNSNDSLSNLLANSSLNNDLIKGQLKDLKQTLMSVEETNKQLLGLKHTNQKLIQHIALLEDDSQRNDADKLEVLNSLEASTAEIVRLKEKNKSLSNLLEKASLLTAAKVTATTYKSKTIHFKDITTKARSVKAIDVCIVLAQNPLAMIGEKDIYIQVLNPKGNVIADKGSVVFGNSTLIYSNKQTIEYNGENLDICTVIEASENDKPLLKGKYYINIFHNDQKLGSTIFELN